MWPLHIQLSGKLQGIFFFKYKETEILAFASIKTIFSHYLPLPTPVLLESVF